MDRLKAGDSERVTEFCPCGSLNSSMWHFFWVSLASHFGLPGSQSIFGISQDPPVCACISYLLAKMDSTKKAKG